MEELNVNILRLNEGIIDPDEELAETIRMISHLELTAGALPESYLSWRFEEELENKKPHYK